MRALLFDALKSIYGRFRNAILRRRLLTQGISLGRNITLFLEKDCALEFGQGCNLGNGSILAVTQESFNPDGRIAYGSINLGDKVFFNEYCNIRASGAPITIGSNSIFAQFVSLIASNHSFDRNSEHGRSRMSADKVGIFIGANAWIGASVSIMPGVTIGDNVIVGANSVVTKDLPSNCIAVGNPAKVVKYI
jgi:acetyltransferase-like isoleucine patch superfamily enzyme